MRTKEIAIEKDKLHFAQMMHLSGEPDRHAEISTCADAASWYPDPLEPQPPDLQGSMCIVPAATTLLLISSMSVSLVPLQKISLKELFITKGKETKASKRKQRKTT